MAAYEGREGYVVPSYAAPANTTWYHFLHGNVPGHQIDFMYRPVVPQGLLAPQHFSHLSRLIKYIEPQTNSEFAFCIGNLSRDDTQHEPGHGGFALLFGFRIRGVTDHAGRRDPPFAHGIAAVDRGMDYASVLSSSLSFYQHLFGKGEYDNPSSVLYREYVKHAIQNPSVIEYVLRAYSADFDDLPTPERSRLALRWRTNEAPQPKRIVIVHPDTAPFGVIAECAARIAAVLYQSDIRWTAITTGRESDVPNGVTVRLVAKRDAAAYASGGPVMAIEEVPDDEAEIARQLFSATDVGAPVETAGGGGWRERYKSQSGLASTPPPPRSDPNLIAGQGLRPSDSGGPRYGARPGSEEMEVDLVEEGSEAGPGAFAGDAHQWSRQNRSPAAPSGAGLHEPPKAWGESAKLRPDEIRAAIGLPPEPPKAWGESAKLSPDEIRAAIGLPPLPSKSATAFEAGGGARRGAEVSPSPAPGMAVGGSEALSSASPYASPRAVGKQEPANSGSRLWLWLGLGVVAALIPVGYLLLAPPSEENPLGGALEDASAPPNPTVRAAPGPSSRPTVSTAGPAGTAGPAVINTGGNQPVPPPAPAQNPSASTGTGASTGRKTNPVNPKPRETSTPKPPSTSAFGDTVLF